ncbi:N-acetylmuramoyl-L-alanine amidase [Cognatishimia activa]|uniref:N-acetylmuramoyl-L-alanine amidase n=1 Tax=Cognatishimia activa TaxID=1715691 RepID=A0A975ENY3_9RHOB|nr:N-acetylmuramoyl-L-alanine amidase [Cognatishimia activa]QTN35657.1 N-acetylmuramoyl-L-alanine amidase [Cognatishimia activa]
MSRLRSFCLGLCALVSLAAPAFAQDFTALARVDVANSAITDARRGGVQIDLSLSQGLPWRIFTLDEPRRLVIDFREVDWTGVNADALDRAKNIADVRVGAYRPGWSRMVADLSVPMALKTAEMKLGDGQGPVVLSVGLEAASAEDFAAKAGAPNDPRWDLPEAAITREEREAKPDWAPTVIVLDPGHGGIDPGAERGEWSEKQITLQFARELRDTLRRAGNFEIILTRREDTFVSLERRVAIAHEVAADIFISLHADTVLEGYAQGATVYTLSDEASDAASQYLAERHNRSDVLSGIDLTGTEDQVAEVLLDIARRETAPRSERLAKAMVLGMQGAVGELNKHPYRQGGFSVLKAADIPSVLIEIGFMSSERDLANITDPAWRQALANGIRDGLQAWVVADETARNLTNN